MTTKAVQTRSDVDSRAALAANAPSPNVSVAPARSLAQAASGPDATETYTAVNGLDEHDEIARLAYQYYEERGGQSGSAHDDWSRAEAEIRHKRNR